MNMKNGAKWRGVIVPKKFEQINEHLFIDSSLITLKLAWIIWRWKRAKCVWDENTKLGQTRRYQSWDSLSENRLRRKRRLTQISFRCFKSISVSKFTRDILHSRLITHPPPNLFDLVDAYNSTLTSLIDIHAPLKTIPIRGKPINKWYTSAISALKA